MATIHTRTAELLLPLLIEAWRSEEAMTAVFNACKRGPTFDRTAHGRAIVQKLFEDAWSAAHDGNPPVPVLMDRCLILAALHPLVEGDFNLFTQVAPNLVDFHLDVKREGLSTELKTLAEEFSTRTDVPNPFTEKRPKVKVTAATHPPETVRRYAYAVALIKAESILRGADFPNLSHRVTPFGKTPAFSDGANFCQLPAAGDSYCAPKGTSQMAFVSWGAAGEQTLPVETLDDGTMVFPCLPEGFRAFRSESGGSMLQQALISRRAAFVLWGMWAKNPTQGVVIFPRVNSVQVIGPEDFLGFLETKLAGDPAATWTRGQRPELLKA